MMTTTSIESTTQSIARQLLQQSRQYQNPLQWDNMLMQWAMENDRLRVPLFQLIDCLPVLKTKAEIARHLQEYLVRPDLELPAGLKPLLKFAQPESLAGQVAATTFVKSVEALSHRYIAGETLAQMLKTIARLRHDRLAFSLDWLGEAVLSGGEADGYVDRALNLMTQLSQVSRQWETVPIVDVAGLPKVQISVKLTAFDPVFDAWDQGGSFERVGDRLRPLLRAAKRLGCGIHFDMEQYAHKTLTRSILKRILNEPEFRHWDGVGVTVQAYLRESAIDLEDWIGWARERGTPITIRLVKGAYWDQEVIRATQNGWEIPVYTDKAETDRNFEALTQVLLNHHEVVYSAIASHNARSVAKSIAVAKSLAIPERNLEFQVLYGMGDELARSIVDLGYRVRVYCPVGAMVPGMAYLIRRLLENTANGSVLTLRSEDMELLVAKPTGESGKQHFPVRDGRVFYNVADLNPADDQLRDRLLTRVETMRSQFGKRYNPYINEDWVNTNETAKVMNPSNSSETLGTIGLANRDQAEQAIQAATRAFLTWRNTPVLQRTQRLRKLADLIEANREELAAWVVWEVAKPIAQTNGELSEAIDFCRYYAAEMERLAIGYTRDFPGETNRMHYQPRGVTLVISPWNFPIAIPIGMIAAALVTGNTVVFKPATPAALIAAKLTELIIEAGFPPGVFNYLPAQGETIGTFLVEHPNVHLITFTGSHAIGSQIYAQAAKSGQHHVKHVIAEMGGKNAIIIDETADVDAAIAGVIQSAFGYSGQKCSAASRVIVLQSIYDQFLQRLIDAVQSQPIGSANQTSTRIGPVIHNAAKIKIQSIIDRSRTESPIALQGPAPDGNFVAPTIFSPVAPDSTLAQTEIFGPVLAIIPAATLTEAIAIANNTPYALTGGLYSRTPSHIQTAQRDLQVGNLYINRGITGAIVDRQPFGGFGLSGMGHKAGGPDYLLQFMTAKVITENIQRQGFAPL